MQNKTTPFLYIAFLSAFSLLTFDLYQPALPTITDYFNTSHALGQLTLSLFFFAFGLSQLLWGPLIDHYGRQKCLSISLPIFLIATIACVVATSIEMLIVARIIQGFSICCAHVVAFSSSRDIEDVRERAHRLSHISMIVSISPILAPLFGSLVFMHFGWQATFVLMAILGTILFILSRLLLCESPTWPNTANLSLFGPTLKNYHDLLTYKSLWITIAIITFAYCSVMIVIVNAAYLIIDILNISPFKFSLIFAMNGFMFIIGNYLGIVLREKKTLTWNIRAGSLIMIFGSVVMLIIYYFQGLTLLSLAPVLLVSLGVSIINPPTLSLALKKYQEQAGMTIALINTVRITLSSILSSLVGFLLLNHSIWLSLSLLFCSLFCFLFTLLVQGAET